MKKAIIALFLFTAILTSSMAGGEDVMTRRISVTGNTGRVVFELNDSNAADDLWSQLPFDVEVENFSNNEKIFYPENELDTANTPSCSMDHSIQIVLFMDSEELSKEGI